MGGIQKIKNTRDECRRMEAADKESADEEEWQRRNWSRLWYEKWNREWLEEANELVRRQAAEAEAEEERNRKLAERMAELEAKKKKKEAAERLDINLKIAVGAQAEKVAEARRVAEVVVAAPAAGALAVAESRMAWKKRRMEELMAAAGGT